LRRTCEDGLCAGQVPRLERGAAVKACEDAYNEVFQKAKGGNPKAPPKPVRRGNRFPTGWPLFALGGHIRPLLKAYLRGQFHNSSLQIKFGCAMSRIMQNISTEMRLVAAEVRLDQISYACALEAMVAGKTRSSLHVAGHRIGLPSVVIADILGSWEARATLMRAGHELLEALIPVEAAVRCLANDLRGRR
jgi:hypothetical protein